MFFRRVTVSLLSLSIAINPVMAQTVAPVVNNANLEMDANQTENYARLIFKWQVPRSDRIKAKQMSSLLELELPATTNADPAVLKTRAGEFVVGSALSADKKTLRLALAHDVRVEISKHGNYDVVDLVLKGRPSPGKFNPNKKETQKVSEIEELLKPKEQQTDTLSQKLINRPAPKGARVLSVDAAQSKLFTRITINGVNANPLFARKGDRVALTIPGIYALDIGELRASLPKRVTDLVRYNDNKYTSVVMDVAPGSVVRKGSDRGKVYVDIFPPGTNLDAPDASTIERENGKNDGNVDAKAAKNDIPDAMDHGENASIEKKLPLNDAADKNGATEFTQAEEYKPPEYHDPAPSGVVKVINRQIGSDYVLDFGFDDNAPAAIFRRGANIFILFGTNAKFNIDAVKKSNLYNAITPVSGDGVAGVKITAADNIAATPAALGKHWIVTIAPKAPKDMRTILIKGEKTPDGASRLKATVPDAVTTGSINDTDVGDTILVGMSYGPPSALMQQRSYLEASFLPTYHGLAVIPRTEDMGIKLAMDGFVIDRPHGMELSNTFAAGEDDTQNHSVVSAPGFVDFVKWRLGPMADFTNNLQKLRQIASNEIDDNTKGIQAQINLARFYLAWEMGEEALGVVKVLRSMHPEQQNDPELLAMMGIAQTMMGRGREALQTLNSLELKDDAASHLWATIAAMDAGNPEEATKQFEQGAPALETFSKDYQAKFVLADAMASLQTKDYAGAVLSAKKANELAGDPHTKEMARLIEAQSEGELGQFDGALQTLQELAKSIFPDISARAQYASAMMGVEKDPSTRNEAIKTLDSLRYMWRGDDLEIDILRNLGELYIEAGDIRSGLSILASASTLRPDLQASRDLRDVLSRQFKYLFLDGGADGMDSVQALALFYDFRNLTPVGPEGDMMVRGLADKLVALDLLPQAEELLSHQVEKRLQGFTKAQVATDLAAIYLIDKNPEKALYTIGASRVADLPENLNHYRRMIEAIALTDLGRNDHALELIEFDKTSDADKIRAEVYWRQGDMQQASLYANKNLPRPALKFSPNAASDVLRAALAKSLSGDRAGAMAMARSYGPGMNNTEFAPAFNVVTSENIPTPDAIKTAVDSVRGSSPFYNVIESVRDGVQRLREPEGNQYAAAVPNIPTDGNPMGLNVRPNPMQNVQDIAKEMMNATQEVAAKTFGKAGNNAAQSKPKPIAQTQNPPQSLNRAPEKRPAPVAKKPVTTAQKANPPKNNLAANKQERKPFGLQAPKDPPITAVGR